MMENVILVLNEGNSKHVENTLWTRQGLATKRILRQTLDQVIANFGVDKVLLAPFKIDELLL